MNLLSALEMIPVNDQPHNSSPFWQTVSRIGDMMAVDFCPGANRYVHWLKHPLAVLSLLLLGSFVCGLYLNPAVLLLSALVFVVMLIGTLLPWLSMRGISCDVQFDVSHVRCGSPVLIRLQIQNRCWWPVCGVSLIEGFTRHKDASRHDEGIALSLIPARCTAEYSWSFVPVARGLYPIGGRALVETSFPFGLNHIRKTANINGPLTVWPKSVPLQGVPEDGQSFASDDEYSDRLTGDFGDVLGTRLFREGDSLRRIHWAQTARCQTLVVTERQAPVSTSVTVLVDLSPESHPEEHRPESVDRTVEVAASLCESLYQQHCRIDLLLPAERSRDCEVIPVASDSGLRRALNALAVVDIVDGSGSATASSLRAIRPGTVAYCVTTSASAETRPTSGFRIETVLPGDQKAQVEYEGVSEDAWLSLPLQDDLDQLKGRWKGACRG